MNNTIGNSRSVFAFIVLAVSLLAYILLSYFIQRPQFLQVAFLFTILFAGYFFVLQKKISSTHFYWLVSAGIIFRLSLLFNTPNLSDDVYRFIWDGKLSAAGINPFNFLPSESLTHAAVDGITPELYNLLNSKEYYTIYPPVMQFVFWIGGLLFHSTYATIIFYKCVLVVADIFNFYFLLVLLKHFGKPKEAAFIYFLNPLVIIELTANAHFEGLMFFFLLGAAVLFVKRKLYPSAFVFGLSISTKLLPVIFLPLIFSFLGFKKGMIYSFISLAITLLLFSVWIDATTIQNFLTSVDLFFQRFEFNASIYYLVRSIGQSVTGYNIIKWAGPALMMFATASIFFISFYKTKTERAFFSKSLLIITVFYLSATTVHPWYISLPLLLSVFTGFTFPMLWTFVATFSYHAYRTEEVSENLWIVSICYILVFIWAGMEWYFYNKHNKPILSALFTRA